MYQAAIDRLSTSMTTKGDHMTTEATIAAHTEGAAEALAASLRPRAGHRDDLDRGEIARDIDRAVAATNSTLGRSTRSGAALRVKA